MHFLRHLQDRANNVVILPTQYEVELAVGLEGVVDGDEERRLADGLQDLPLCPRVLRRLPLLHDGGLLEDLHRVQLAGVGAVALPGKEDFPVGC